MATIKDIAKETGLGLATISSYLNGGNVREKNRVKIEKAIADLHYEVNETARNLKTNCSQMIGAVIPELDSSFVAKVMSTAEDLLLQKGYALLVCDCRSDPEREKEAIDFLIRKRVDGLINIPVDESGASLKKFARTGKPIVLVDRVTDRIACDTVCTKNKEALYLAVEKLIDAGHERIGMIAGPSRIQAARSRREGYRLALEAHGIKLDNSYLFEGDDSIRSGIKGAARLLADHPDITAIVVSNSAMSQGAIIGLNELGISIPDRVSIIGFDNPEFARAVNPRMTILQQPVEEIGRRAAELMLRRLSGDKENNPEHIWLDTSLIEGKSIRRMK